MYNRKEIETQIPKKLIKDLLLSRTKEGHFLNEDEIYQQIDCVAKGSSLGLIPAGVFAVELETAVAPNLDNFLFK